MNQPLTTLDPGLGNGTPVVRYVTAPPEPSAAKEVCGIGGCTSEQTPGQAMSMHRFRVHGIRANPEKPSRAKAKSAKAKRTRANPARKATAPKETAKLPTSVVPASASEIVDHVLRLVYGDSTPIADAELVADWIGVTRAFVAQAHRPQ